MSKKLYWSCNTGGLLTELMDNNNLGPMRKALEIFGRILAEVGQEASRINDPQMNALMCRLAIYEVADQYNPNYDAKAVQKIKRLAERQRKTIAECEGGTEV